MPNFQLYHVKTEYLDFLRQIDNKVPEECPGRKKFVGIVLDINGQAYYALLLSPKPKHEHMKDNKLDIYKIDGGKAGIINLNNMIPVTEEARILFNIESIADPQYKYLLDKQLRHINQNTAQITHKAKRLYKLVCSRKFPELNARCSDFPLLEKHMYK